MSELSVTFHPAQVTVNLKSAALSTSTGAPVVREFIDRPAYEGEYTVTPTTEAQTLATNGLRMTDDVTVEAMPTATISGSSNVTVNPTLSIDYATGEITASVSKTQSVDVVTEAGYAPVTSHDVVMSGNAGTQLITHDSSDLTVDGPTVTAPDGYYPNPASKTVQSGSVAVPNTSITANPSLSITQNTGRIEASVSKTQSVSPTVSEGYVTSGTSGTMSVSGSNHYDLPTQASATITPTESAQTAVPAHKWTTGEVSVAAIPSDYVGSGVTHNDSTDLSVSGATVTAPAGYYENAASASVPNATWKNASTVGVVPEISVDSNGLITANCAGWTSCKPLSASGYADADTSANIQLSGVKTSQLDTLEATTYTPTTSQQTIAAGQYLTGAQIIESIPSQFHDMSGPLAWMGVDAELVTSFTLADVKLVNTSFNGWTASTTAKDILATRTVGTFTATNMSDNEYVIEWETKIPIVTPETATKKALPIYLAGYHVQGIIRRPSSYANIEASNANSNVNVSLFTAGNFFRYYGSTTGSLTYTWNTSYGLYATVTANTLSNSTAESPVVTLKSPKVSARCSTTYMSTTNSNLIDQDKTIISQKCKVYRIKKRGFIRGCYDEIIRVVNEVIGE